MALAAFVDPKAGKLVTNLVLGGKPESGASAGDGKVYINLTDTAEIVEVDANAAKVRVGAAPGGIETERAGRVRGRGRRRIPVVQQSYSGAG